MDRHDTILCEFIKIMPLVFDVNDIIEKAKLYKSTNRKISYVFIYPGFGRTHFNQNDIFKLYQRAICSTPLRIFTELCFLIERDRETNKRKIVSDIFIFLYLIRKTFYELSRALMISRRYINTCKTHCFYFNIDFPIQDKPSKNKKLYTNTKLIQIETIACRKKLVDPFRFNKCTFNIKNLTQKDLICLNNYLDELNILIEKKLIFDSKKIIIDPSLSKNINIDIDSDCKIIEFTKPINICDIKCNDCNLIYF